MSKLPREKIVGIFLEFAMAAPFLYECYNFGDVKKDTAKVDGSKFEIKNDNRGHSFCVFKPSMDKLMPKPGFLDRHRLKKLSIDIDSVLREKRLELLSKFKKEHSDLFLMDDLFGINIKEGTFHNYFSPQYKDDYTAITYNLKKNPNKFDVQHAFKTGDVFYTPTWTLYNLRNKIIEDSKKYKGMWKNIGVV